MGNNGWIKLYRKLLESDMYNDLTSKQRDVMLVCLLRAQHKPKKIEVGGKLATLQPGQFFTSLVGLQKSCGSDVNIRSIRTAIVKLENWGFLTSSATKSGRLINVINWGKYQGEKEQADKEATNEVTNKNKKINVDLVAQTDNWNTIIDKESDKEATKQSEKSDKQTDNIQEDLKNNTKNDKKSTSTKEEEYRTESEVIRLFNKICTSLPKVLTFTTKRRACVKVLVRSFTLEQIQEAFEKIEESAFLTGRSEKWNGCNFDWVINYNNFVKILEGNYDNLTTHDKEIQIKQQWENSLMDECEEFLRSSKRCNLSASEVRSTYTTFAEEIIEEEKIYKPAENFRDNEELLKEIKQRHPNWPDRTVKYFAREVYKCKKSAWTA